MHLCTCPPPQVAHAIHRLHHGIHSSQGEDRHIYDLAKRDHHSKHQSIQALAPAVTEPIWPEGRAGHLARAHQEGTPRTWVHALKSRPLLIHQRVGIVGSLY